MSASIRVANISDSSSGFRWLDGRLPAEAGVEFVHFDRSPKNAVERRVYKESPYARPDVTGYRACAEAAIAAARGQLDLIVTHLPTFAARMAAMRAALLVDSLAARQKRPRVAHLAWAFHFTNLPTGTKRTVLTRILSNIDHFVVFSNMERALYAEYFSIPEDRFEFVPWCIKPPELPPEPSPEGNFILSVGRTGRDYGVFMRAMKRIPHVRAVVVASPQNLEGLEVPSNVEVKVEIPFEEVTALTHACRFSVLPLVESEVPYGHGVLVLGMFSKKAVLVNRSPGFDDYVKEEESCLSFGWRDDRELADQIDRLWKDPDLAKRLADQAYAFASENCIEERTVDWFVRYADRLKDERAIV